MSPKMPSTVNTATVVQTSTVETHEQAIRRLAGQARDQGIRVLVYPQTNEHFAESVTHPGELHRVTMVSCDCSGFLRHRRCQHLAALLDLYGNLPAIDPEPGPDRGGAALPVPSIEVLRDGAPVDGVEVAMAYADGRWVLTVASREGIQEKTYTDRERHVARAIREAIVAGTPARLTRTEAGGPELTLGYRIGLAFEPVPPAVAVFAAEAAIAA